MKEPGKETMKAQTKEPMKFDTRRRRGTSGATLAAVVVGLGLAGCGDGAGRDLLGTYTVSRPAHPAMTAAASGGGDPHAGHGHDHAAGDPHAGVPGAPPLGPRETGGATRSTSLAPAAGGIIPRLSELGLAVTVPEGWVEEPGSGMRLATIRFPRVESDEVDGEMSVTVIGGSVEANIDRWQGQFAERPEPVRRDWTTPGGVEVTTVKLAGTFTAAMAPRAGGGGAATADTVLLGAIARVPGSDRSLFFKSWGPRATMERWEESFEAFVESLGAER